MNKNANPIWDYFTLLLFVLFLAELVLFIVAIIFGRLIGYDRTLTACLWIGILLAGCFALIVAGNLVFILFQRIYVRILRKNIESH